MSLGGGDSFLKTRIVFNIKIAKANTAIAMFAI